MKHAKNVRYEDAEHATTFWFGEMSETHHESERRNKSRRLRSRRRSGYLRKQAQRQSMGW